MTAAVLSHHVTAYAAQVRAHLADLSPEQLEDLTDGLEADLTEALQDPEGRPVTGEIPLVDPRAAAQPAGQSTAAPDTAAPDPATTSIINLADRFGTPQAYAEELRSAAGLPAPILAKAEKPVRPPFVHRVQARLSGLLTSLVEKPWWPGVRATGEALRPVWWVARGWVLFNIFVTVVSGGEDVRFVPGNPFGILLLLGVVVASVQHGQGRWVLVGKGRRVLTLVSVVAAVGLLPTLVTATGHASRIQYVDNSYYGEAEPIVDGVYLGGLPVTNLFVYDADGQFVDQAQIVDDRGRPVRVDREGGLWDEGQSRYWSAAEDSYGREIWNAFPLRLWSDQDGEWDENTQGWVLRDGATPAVMPPPFAQLAPLVRNLDGTATGPEAPADPAPGDAATLLPPPDSTTVDPAPVDPAPVDQAPVDPAAPGVAVVPPAG